MIIDEIKHKMEYIEKVTQELGYKLEKDNYHIEDQECPHKIPSKLPQGYAAVYIFIYEHDDTYEFLKIGKANSNSNSRFTSQHYGFKAPSTLAKSICKDEYFVKLGLNENNIKAWMLENLHRINIYVKSDKALTELIEAILHYTFRPKYEGDIN